MVPFYKKATTLNFVAIDVSLECTKSVHSCVCLYGLLSIVFLNFVHNLKFCLTHKGWNIPKILVAILKPVPVPRYKGLNFGAF